MKVNSYRIDYKWREPDNGQKFRVWQKAFMIVKAVSAKDAENAFERAWSGNNEFRIVSCEQVGV